MPRSSPGKPFARRLGRRVSHEFGQPLAIRLAFFPGAGADRTFQRGGPICRKKASRVSIEIRCCILDSKEAVDRPIVETSPIIDQFLTAEPRISSQRDGGLDRIGVAWTRDPRLVRGSILSPYGI